MVVPLPCMLSLFCANPPVNSARIIYPMIEDTLRMKMKTKTDGYTARQFAMADSQSAQKKTNHKSTVSRNNVHTINSHHGTKMDQRNKSKTLLTCPELIIYSIDWSTIEFNVSSSAVHCLPVGNVLRMSNCVIINIYVTHRKQYHRLLLSHLPPFNGIILCSRVFTVFGVFL